MRKFEFYSDVKKLYLEMMKDIIQAKKRIFLETYIFEEDFVGDSFKEVLIKKAKEGVSVVLLVDSWGSNVSWNYFNDLISAGGVVKFFKVFLYEFKSLNDHHKRDHRKLLLIDDNISYIGSANITASSLTWRESVVRLEGKITEYFYPFFVQTWSASNKFRLKKARYKIYDLFEIFGDNSSYFDRTSENKFKDLIDGAKKEVIIDTPYFVPPLSIKFALFRAVKRGVNVKIILPHISDVRIVDFLSNRFLGNFYKKGIEIFYYREKVSHSKIMVVDDYIVIGSSNIDYRSFRHNYEINLLCKNNKYCYEIKKHIHLVIKDCIEFDYENWRKRSIFNRILENIINYFREYF